MHHKALDRTSRDEVRDLFRSVFTASEGEEEGGRIGELAAALCSGIDNEEILGYGTYDDASIIGAIFFTRLRFDEAVRVYMLAPVAVGTAHQGKGVGRALIRHGLDVLKSRSVAVVVTYGDPAFYTRAGFRALPETLIQAPLPLSMPQGWLGQSLTEEPVPVIPGRPACVKSFNDPVYW